MENEEKKRFLKSRGAKVSLAILVLMIGVISLAQFVQMDNLAASIYGRYNPFPLPEDSQYASVTPDTSRLSAMTRFAMRKQPNIITKAFDGDTNTYWYSGKDADMILEYKEEQIAGSYQLNHKWVGKKTNSCDGVVYVSGDGKNYTEIFRGNAGGNLGTETINIDQNFKYLKVNVGQINKQNCGASIDLYEVDLDYLGTGNDDEGDTEEPETPSEPMSQLKAQLSSDTPRASLILAGTSNVELARFDLSVIGSEDVEIDDLTLSIENVDTTNLFGFDTDNDSDMISKLTLVDHANSAVLAESLVINNNKVKFQNMGLVIAQDEAKELSVYVTLNEENYSSGITRSGMTVNAGLSFDDGDYTIRGLSSGIAYDADEINFIEGQGNNLTGVASELIVSKSSGQPTSLNTGEKELLKFTATNTNKSSYLKGVRVHTELQDDDIATPLALNSLALYSGSKKLAECSKENSCYSDNVWDLSEFEMVNGEVSTTKTYTIKGTFSGVAVDDSVTASIEFPALNGSYDHDIIWQDYGTDGRDGAVWKWIDVPTLTTISNTISK